MAGKHDQEALSELRKRLLSGFEMGESRLYVPAGLHRLLADEGGRRGLAGQLSGQVPLAAQEPQPEVAIIRPGARGTKPLRKARPTLRQVFKAEDVAAFEAKIAGTHKGGDRRRAMDSMLNGFRHGPIGMRKVVCVPKRLDAMLAGLEAEMPNFHEVIDVVRTSLHLQQAGDKAIKLPPMLLGGEPGIGKTYFAMRLARFLGIEGDVVNMETASASFILSGGDLSWSSAAPGRIFDLLVHGGLANPMLVLEELDKAGGEKRYDPVKSLYALLEPGTARAFRDESCREVPLDVSGFNWIATANDVELIPSPLRNRMTEFVVPAPTPLQRKAIVQCVYRNLRKRNKWGRRFMPTLGDAVVDMLANGDDSVRVLERRLTEAFAHAWERRSHALAPEDVRRRRTSSPVRRMGFI